MTIRMKVALGMLIISASFILFRSYQLLHDFEGHFREAEVSEMSEKIDVLKSLLDVEIDRMTLHVLDNAYWDDMYDFVDRPNQEFVEINFPDYGLSSIRVSFALIADVQGSVLMEKGWDLTDGRALGVPVSIRRMVTDDQGTMRFNKTTDRVSGIVAQDGVIYLISARPILHSDESGPVRGTLLMGRRLDDELVQTYAGLLKRQIAVSALSIDKLKWFETNKYLQEEEIAYVVNNRESASVGLLMDDVFGHPAVMLRLDSPRSGCQEGYEATVNAILALVALVLLLVLLFQLMLEKIVLTRLSRLSAFADRAEFSLKKIEIMPGRDEIAQLSRSFSLVLEHLYAEKSKLDSIIESIGEGIFVCDTAGRIVLINRAMSRMLGLKAGLNGKVKVGTKVKFTDSRTSSVRTDVIAKVLGSAESLDIPQGLTLVHRNGSRIPIHLRGVPLIQDGITQGGVFVCRDISREKEMDDTRNTFLSTMALYLAQPIERMSWYLQLLLREKKTFSIDERGAIEEIDDLSQGLLQLIDDLSILTALEVGKNPIGRAKQIGVSKLLDEVLKGLEKGVKDKDMKIETKLDSGCCILGDPKEVGRLFEIFLSNAIKYSKPGDTIRINCMTGGEACTISFADSGIGIPKDEQENIFRGFYRASNNQGENGFGLGLHLAKLIVEAHKGKISLKSEEGKGSEFRVTFPLCGKRQGSQSQITKREDDV